MWRGVIFAALLAGCQSTTPLQQMSYEDTKKLALELHDRCAKQGYPQGHPEFDACIQQEVTREAYSRQETAAARRRFASAMGGAMAEQGRQMQQNAAANRPINCTSTPNSSWLNGPIHSVSTVCR